MNTLEITAASEPTDATSHLGPLEADAQTAGALGAIDMTPERDSLETLRAAMTRRRGMTLVEIMVVIILIAGIGTALAVGVFGSLGRNEAALVDIKLSKIGEQLDAYYLQNREFPDSLQTLVDEDYLEEDMLTDPWKNNIQLTVNGPRSYELCSPGDGEGEAICKKRASRRGK
ncbi:MAG: general secretion pathway protein G [Myxococcota bacterium]|jgi:general secretion pathway protein G